MIRGTSWSSGFPEQTPSSQHPRSPQVNVLSPAARRPCALRPLLPATWRSLWPSGCATLCLECSCSCSLEPAAYLSLSSCSSLRSVGGCFSLALLHLQPTLGSESIRSLRIRGVTVSRAVRKVAVKWWTPFWWKVSSTGVIRDNSLVFRRLWSLRGGLYYIISI